MRRGSLLWTPRHGFEKASKILLQLQSKAVIPDLSANPLSRGVNIDSEKGLRRMLLPGIMRARAIGVA